MGKADRLKAKKQEMLDEEAVGTPILTITIEVDKDDAMRINGPDDFITLIKVMVRAMDAATDKAHAARIKELNQIKESEPEEKRIITKIH